MSTDDDLDEVQNSVRKIVELGRRQRIAAPAEDASKFLEERIGEIVGEATPVNPDKPADDKKRIKRQRTRHFAIGLFFVALFLMSLSAVFPREDVWFWAGSSVLILIVAAWHWDKSRPDVD